MAIASKLAKLNKTSMWAAKWNKTAKMSSTEDSDADSTGADDEVLISAAINKVLRLKNATKYAKNLTKFESTEVSTEVPELEANDYHLLKVSAKNGEGGGGASAAGRRELLDPGGRARAAGPGGRARRRTSRMRCRGALSLFDDTLFDAHPFPPPPCPGLSAVLQQDVGDDRPRQQVEQDPDGQELDQVGLIGASGHRVCENPGACVCTGVRR